MHASEVTREVVERANELYWGSDESVNQIADDLELSKGALYGIIEPEASGRGCPLCGDEVVYANRTAKDRGMLACPTCDWDGTLEDAMAEPVEDDPTPPSRDAGRTSAPDDEARPTGDQEEDGPRSAGEQEDPPAETDPDTTSPSDRVPSRPLAHADARTVAGGALLGAAVGLALVLWARRR